MKSKDVQDYLRISRQKLYTLNRDGYLKPFKSTGRMNYYKKEDVDAFLGLQGSTVQRKVVVYYRVSSSSQKKDLQHQLEYLENYVASNGIKVDEYIKDIGSGINYKKPGLRKLIRMIDANEVSTIIIAYKDRLIRFGYDLIEYIADLHGTKIEVINLPSVSPQEELVDDLMTIIHVFSARLYGLRHYKKSDFLGKEDEDND